MMSKPHVEDVRRRRHRVIKPETWVAGVPGVTHSMGPALKQMGVSRSLKTLTPMNQKDGFDCMSCAWPDPDHRKTLEFCENGAKALTWEASPVKVPSSFWAEHSTGDLLTKSEYWLLERPRMRRRIFPGSERTGSAGLHRGGKQHSGMKSVVVRLEPSRVVEAEVFGAAVGAASTVSCFEC